MRTGGVAADWKIIAISPALADVCRSPRPDQVWLGHPSLIALPGGRLVASLDLAGPGVKGLPGAKGRHPYSGHWMMGRILLSTDKGKTWTVRAEYPFHQARLFRVGSAVYLLGIGTGLRIMRSFDGGENWTKPSDILAEEGREYAQTAGSVLCTRSGVYLALWECAVHREGSRWGTGPWLPLVLRGSPHADLTHRKSWVRSERLAWARNVSGEPGVVSHSGMDRDRGASDDSEAVFSSWTAAHILPVKNPGHPWHDPAEEPACLLAQTKSRGGQRVIAGRLVEDSAGAIRIDIPAATPGACEVCVSLPCGGFAYDVFYDDVSRAYWLVGNAPFRRAVFRGSRHGLSIADSDARCRLALWFSHDLLSWQFAALLDRAVEQREVRHSPSLVAVGTSLYFLCCAGRGGLGRRAYTDRITFHEVTDFRELANAWDEGTPARSEPAVVPSPTG